MKNLYIEAKQRGQFRTFFNNDSEIVALFHTGEVTIAVGYPGNALDSQREGDPVEFAICKEGQIVWTCGYGISTTCKNIDAAYALIDYYLSPEAQAFEVNEWSYFPTLETTLDLLDPKVRAQAEIVRELGQHRAGSSADRGLRRVDPRLARGEEELVAQAVPQSAWGGAGRGSASPSRRCRSVFACGALWTPSGGAPTRSCSSCCSTARSSCWPRSRSTTPSSSRCRGAASRRSGIREALSDSNLRQALRNSVIVSSIVAPASVILGTLAAYPITRLRFRLRGGAAMLLAAPLVVPWLVIGISALIYFNKAGVALSWHTVVLMHIVVTFPLVTVLMSASMARFDRTQEESAIDLGASQLQVVRHVLLPHIAPSLMASFILAFSWSFNNFEITYFVGGFDQLFPVWVYSTLRHASNLPIVNADLHARLDRRGAARLRPSGAHHPGRRRPHLEGEDRDPHGVDPLMAEPWLRPPPRTASSAPARSRSCARSRS